MKAYFFVGYRTEWPQKPQKINYNYIQVSTWKYCNWSSKSPNWIFFGLNWKWQNKRLSNICLNQTWIWIFAPKINIFSLYSKSFKFENHFLALNYLSIYCWFFFGAKNWKLEKKSQFFFFIWHQIQILQITKSEIVFGAKIQIQVYLK